mgnify:CR=1 FL=1
MGQFDIQKKHELHTSLAPLRKRIEISTIHEPINAFAMNWPRALNFYLYGWMGQLTKNERMQEKRHQLILYRAQPVLHRAQPVLHQAQPLLHQAKPTNITWSTAEVALDKHHRLVVTGTLEKSSGSSIFGSFV